MKRIVLVGAGHVHVALLAQSHAFRAAGIELVLVDPGSFWYGANVASLLAGRVRARSLRVSLRELCRERSAHLQVDRAIGLDRRHRRVWLAGGSTLEYDAVAVNVGQEVALDGYDGRAHGVRVWSAASVNALAQLREALEADCALGCRQRVAIVGSNARAAAIAAGLAAADFASRLGLAVYAPGPRLLSAAPAGAARRLARVFARRDIDLVFDTAIEGVAQRAVYSQDGRRFAADHVVLADGYRASRFVHAGGLAAETDGLYVGSRLHTPADERVFASGGCARLPGGPLAIEDVQGQARVLGHNLRASLARRPYRRYGPRRYSGLIDLANGCGIGWFRGLWWHGRAVARIKARRDARFVSRLYPKANR